MADNKKAPLESEGWRRFIPLTDDPAKLNHIAELIQVVGKDDIVFILQNLKLNPAVDWSSERKSH